MIKKELIINLNKTHMVENNHNVGKSLRRKLK